MSPLHLRRYRAERLLRSEFEAQREQVLGPVRRKLAALDVTLAEADLDDCYAQAWQGLYAAILEDEQIDNPAGWLVTVVFRRAIDEHRSRSHPGRPARDSQELVDRAGDGKHDFADALDARVQLRQLLEGISGRLNERERQAATLCVLQGLPREQAARHMGIGARHMKRLMDGRRGDKPRAGVTKKLGALIETISDGRFCEQQASLMRALAFGLLDPEGERHRLAIAHQRSCPACRAYVLQLRGLAAALPPVFLPGLLRLLGRRARALSVRRRPRLGVGSQPGGGGLGSLAAAKLAAVGLILAGAGVGVATLVSSGHSGTSAHTHARSPSAPGSSSAGRAAPAVHVHARASGAKRRHDRRARSSKGSRRLHVTSKRAVAPSQREFSFERPGADGTEASPASAGSATSGAKALREFGIE